MEENKKHQDAIGSFEKYSQKDEHGFYELKLYITGMTPNSVRAVNNIKSLCQQYFNNNCTLEIIDVYQNPGLAKEENIIATPTLVKKSPSPVYRVVGNLSDTAKVLKLLGININE
jgi:circadian clock protein KaiB